MATREKKESMTLRRKIARQSWGEINYQESVTKGVTWISCSGHGGYVVDALLFPEVRKVPDLWMFEVVPYIRDGPTVKVAQYYTRHKNRFYAFEEDCRWAVLCYFTSVGERDYKKREELRRRYSMEAYSERMLGVLNRWFNDERYPEIMQRLA